MPEQPSLRGVAAVVLRGERFLVIRRSQQVRAPGRFCFPGGGVQDSEEEGAAIERELREELNLTARASRCLWKSVTPWGVQLAWWSVEITDANEPVPNPAEVETVHWLTADEMLALPDLLESNREFLAACRDGRLALLLD